MQSSTMQPFLYANLLHHLFSDGLNLYGETRINLCSIELEVLQHFCPYRGKHLFLQINKESRIYGKRIHAKLWQSPLLAQWKTLVNINIKIEKIKFTAGLATRMGVRDHVVKVRYVNILLLPWKEA